MNTKFKQKQPCYCYNIPNDVHLSIPDQKLQHWCCRAPEFCWMLKNHVLDVTFPTKLDKNKRQ